MSTTAHKAERARSEIMHDIEARHFGRCIDQLWDAQRRSLLELMDYPKAGCTVILYKRFEGRVPRSGSGKPWPELEVCYVYVPIEDETNSWTGLDKALFTLEDRESNRRLSKA